MRKLLEVLHRLVDLGNSVIIIEHNLDVIRNADWVIDLGPEGGEDGGHIVGEGRPAKIAATPGSYTGQFLKRYYKLSNGRLAPTEPEEELIPVVDSTGNGVSSSKSGPSSANGQPEPEKNGRRAQQKHSIRTARREKKPVGQ